MGQGNGGGEGDEGEGLAFSSAGMHGGA